ncbi:MAG: adenosylcobinamide-GDP ribazoletransferase [Bacillota bacterium]
MSILKAAALMFSMFTRIPMPKVEWSEENLRYMLCFFPLAGVVIGLVLAGWFWFCGVFHIGTLLFAAGVTLIPVAVTGGIHLDGYCDTVDALASHASPERKREILKDPHTGAFAIIGAGAYLLLYFSISTELIPNIKTWLLLALMHGLSRTLSGLSVIGFPSSASKGLLDAFKASADKKRSAAILLLLLAGCVAGLWLTAPVAGGAMILAALFCALYLFNMSKRQFGGMSGDLAGYFLQLCELAMLAALVLIQKVVIRWY